MNEYNFSKLVSAYSQFAVNALSFHKKRRILNARFLVENTRIKLFFVCHLKRKGGALAKCLLVNLNNLCNLCYNNLSNLLIVSGTTIKGFNLA